jgi:hypothetical protein
MARQIDILEDGTPVESGTTAGISDPPKKQYSTTEEFTGEYWIDGKPIYRQVFEGTTPATAGTQKVDSLIPSGIDTPIKSDLIVTTADGHKFSCDVLLLTDGTMRYIGILRVSPLGELVYIISLTSTAGGYVNLPYIVIAYYTKV